MADPSRLEIAQNALRNSADGSTLRMVTEMIDARLEEMRRANDTTSGDETRVMQGKCQFAEELKMLLQLQQV